MIDINKSRNSFQKFPILKQKCDPNVIVQQHQQYQTFKAATNNTTTTIKSTKAATSNSHVKTTTATSHKSYEQQNGSFIGSGNGKSKATVTAPSTTVTVTATATATTPTTATALKGSTAGIPKLFSSSKSHVKEIQARLTTDLSRVSPPNAVRAANQNFFLVPAFKDQNFLKEECELAHAQVVANGAAPNALRRTQKEEVLRAQGGDKCNNNASNRPHNIHINYNSNSNSNNRVDLDRNISNISSNNNHNHSHNKSIHNSQLSRLATISTNGMRRSGGGNGPLGSSTTTATSSSHSHSTNSGPAISNNSNNSNSNTTTGAHKVDIVFNHYKPPAKSYKPSALATASTTVGDSVTSSTSTSTRVTNGRHLVKPLVHRTIPATAVAAANAAATASSANHQHSEVSRVPTTYGNKANISNNNNNNNINNNNNNSYTTSSGSSIPHTTGSNNNMHQQHPCRRHESFDQDHDDIKYIDSDDAPAPTLERKSQKAGVCEQRCCSHAPVGSGSVSWSVAGNRTRIRPKSTIICSSTSGNNAVSAGASSSNNQLVFEKVNNYKYANGDALITGTGGSAATNRRLELRSSGIDSSSIKASIEKFNSFSEQKRLPLSSVTLRSHGGSGSTSNLPHHRHSSDFDNSNLRVGSSGGSLTRSPYRTNGISAAPTGKMVVVSMHAAAASSAAYSSASRLAALSNNGSGSASASSSASSTNSLPTKSGSGSASGSGIVCNRQYESSLERTSATAKDTHKGAATVKLQQQDVVAGGDAKKHAAGEGGACDASAVDSIRSTSARSTALPPASPSSSRYWDRESSRTSSLSTANYNNTDDVIKPSSDEKSEGLCGLRNIGNTCFMNSVIQCLSHTNELTKFLRTHNGTRSSSSKDQQILYEFAKLIREMWTNNVHSVTPMELKRAFSTKHRMYSDYNQQDAQEFLRFFLDSLHSALNTGVKGEHLKIDDNLSDNKKADLTWEWYTRHENSLIRDLFVGQLKSTLKCTTCGNTSVTFDPFWDLSVPLPSSNRCKLDSCLDLFIREEILDGDEMPTCSKCQTRRRCTKSFTIQRFPKYLVIHLKRFSETRWSKLSNIVEFPTGERELNMGPYGSNHNTNIYYSLYAISNHMGSTAGGHYVALCKHPVSKKWHEFNDNIVSDALSENHLVSSSAYILFYERA